MDRSDYIIGQRWVSNTESELGLGIVIENNGRLLTLAFPATGERRTYAVDNAPISRVEYSVGDQISNDEGVRITVIERLDKDGVFIYVGKDEVGNLVQLDELELDSLVQFSKPQDRLFAGQVDKNSSFQLRLETFTYMRKHQQSSAFGLLGPRVQLLPHQFYIADQVAQRHAPRVLLADEVGLGKTIEAGLILHQQLISGSASRVLIIVPDSLVHQWLVEMLRRFNLLFTILDEERCQAITEFNDINPFETAQTILCSLAFLTKKPERHAQAMLAGWDLLVVDEAHYLQWSETIVSDEYLCIEQLAHKVLGLLLLTATPEQLGVDSHFARLRLLDPDRYYDLNEFRAEEAGYQQLSRLIDQLQHENIEQRLRDTSELVEQLNHYLGDDLAANLLASEDFDHAIDKAIQHLLDRHGTGRVLFRNTRDTVKGFSDRKLNTYVLPRPELYKDNVRLKELLHPELLLGSQWWMLDPRVNWLSGWLRRHRHQKVLVICALASTAVALEKHLRLRSGVRSAVFHEGLSLVVRDRAAAYFGEQEEGAQILVCSEIGSEGRNFQFAHHLVLFDLPLNPDLLEQRIGRLDRIGQTETVQIHIPYYQDSAQAGLMRWYDEGLNAFEHVCAVGTNLFETVGDSLRVCLQTGNEQSLDEIISQTHELSDNLVQKLKQGRDRLLELSSCHPQHAAKLVENVANAAGQLELATYMEKIFDYFGVDNQVHSAHAIILHPGDHMLCHKFPGLTEDGLTATYQRTQALIREDMHFLTWEHPMVRGAMDMMLVEDAGTTAFCTLKIPSLRAGTLLLEAIFTVNCAAPKELQLHRYLPLTIIRIVIDNNQQDLSRILTAQKMNQLANRVPKQSLLKLIKHARPQISELIVNAEKIAASQQEAIINVAQREMTRIQKMEIERLKSLAKVNPNIRKEEVEFLGNNRDMLKKHLQASTLKLDAIRVALAIL